MPCTCLLLSVHHDFIELMSHDCHEHHDQSKCGFQQDVCTYFRMFKMYLLLVLKNVHTSGFAKCTYFWFCKMYILLVLQIVYTSGFVKCTYFWINNMYILLLYLILVLQFCTVKMYLLLDLLFYLS